MATRQRFVLRALEECLRAVPMLVYQRLQHGYSLPANPLEYWDLWQGWTVAAAAEHDEYKTGQISLRYAWFTRLFPTLCARIAQEPSPRPRFLQFMAPYCHAYRDQVSAFGTAHELVHGGDEEYMALAFAEASTFCSWEDHVALKAAMIMSAWKTQKLDLVVEYPASNDMVGCALPVEDLALTNDGTQFEVLVTLPYDREDAKGEIAPTTVLTLGCSVYNSLPKRIFTELRNDRRLDITCSYFLQEPELEYVKSVEAVLPQPGARVPTLMEQSLAVLLRTQWPAATEAVTQLMDMKRAGQWPRKRKLEESWKDRRRLGKFPRLDLSS